MILASQSNLQPCTHDVFQSLYVVSGRVRLVLGDHDLVLGVGEAAELDTQMPYWFGSTGAEPADALSFFGRLGEHMHTRAGHSGGAH